MAFFNFASGITRQLNLTLWQAWAAATTTSMTPALHALHSLAPRKARIRHLWDKYRFCLLHWELQVAVPVFTTKLLLTSQIWNFGASVMDIKVAQRRHRLLSFHHFERQVTQPQPSTTYSFLQFSQLSLVVLKFRHYHKKARESAFLTTVACKTSERGKLELGGWEHICFAGNDFFLMNEGSQPCVSTFRYFCCEENYLAKPVM